MLAQAIEAEVEQWIESRAHVKDKNGHRQVVRNGHLPARKIQSGVGAVQVKQPRVRDRRPPEDREQFSSSILPRYLRKTKSVEELIPWLYLKGVSTGDFTDALQALRGPAAPGLSASTITRLKTGWETEYHSWSQRSLEGKHYVYVWADGVYFNVRLESEGNRRQCILVLIGATEAIPVPPEVAAPRPTPRTTRPSRPSLHPPGPRPTGPAVAGRPSSSMSGKWTRSFAPAAPRA
jgi:putative transposase